MRSKVTIKDVARYVGVVPSTVSRAINDHPEVGPETKARVREAVELLGYRPDRLARSIRQGRTQSVSVMV
ncbi:periplasmic binding protein/LacI transcriptional regulator, partial [Deinococcus aerius]